MLSGIWYIHLFIFVFFVIWHMVYISFLELKFFAMNVNMDESYMSHEVPYLNLCTCVERSLFKLVGVLVGGTKA